MITKNLLSALFMIGLIASPVYAATSSSQVTKPIRAWKTENNKDKKTGQFDNCLVKNMYDNGTVMILAQNSAGVERLALHFPQNKMQKDQHFDLAIQIDRKDVFPVEAVAISSQILTIGIPQALPDQMRKGQLLHLRGPNDEVIYTMDGMDGAVSALRDCVMTQNNTVQPIPDMQVADAEPVPAPVIEAKSPAPALPEPITSSKKIVESKPVAAKEVPAKAITPAAPPSKPVSEVLAAKAASAEAAISALADKIRPQKTIETAQETLLPGQWNSIFARTDLLPDKLVPLKPSRQEQPVDYIWQKNGLFIGVKQKKVTPAVTLDKTAHAYLTMLKARCEGEFVAEASPIQQGPDESYSLQVAEGACSNGKKEDSLAALLFFATPLEIKVFFFEAPMQKGPDAVKARDAVMSILEEQFR